MIDKLQHFENQGRNPKDLDQKTRRKYISSIFARDDVKAGMLAMVDSDPRLPVFGDGQACYRYGLAGLCGESCPAFTPEDDGECRGEPK